MILIALHRVGPYHHARLQCLADRLELTVLETRPLSCEYPWDSLPSGSYTLHSLRGATDPESDPPTLDLDQQLAELLDRCLPAVIVSVGWADRSYQRLVMQAWRRRIPLVLISDSRWRDEPRQPWKEAIKRGLLRGYSAALVAGSESRAYLGLLGFPSEAIFRPWDVVDNVAFRRPPERPRDSGIPHFLCVSRFVPKKNHIGLLTAYGDYQRQSGRWGLRLIGTGPCEPLIREAVACLPDPIRVSIEPFLQLPALAAAYGAASAFVLASHTDQWGLVVNEAMAAGLPVIVSRGCGCAVDLIEEGRTGWSFDPVDPAALTACLHAVERLPEPARRAVTAAATERLEDFTPERFADGLWDAVEWARRYPRHSRRSAIVASLLSQRCFSPAA
ncbi:glycosyltransferase [Synechococcus sp. Cruz-9H2]|uniref:glycosyltransferase family 4 protein n=1 Tax=unclassified Synechococcus TaxID=2626047 RepID=UPI0020CBE4D3|nr:MULTISPECIES: glycosyltransferase [unclassified Synechococcus]MCP9820646.1 glycosyltransferase [Synechococcus sp. Cruz-9H2]MCP9844844.1 glycosyltransferase [Synechococcus sp. Edmonson 11F2]MCP9856966.1 glycosyltransferase [Synechococcus sp. Cruz-9C9]MCP9864252.1 glycosyltransferase [Synechococcus sp. Cruz-7E5]MCP9871521.1 glycosyltransferase [Synechococcus sp. Cruz-7B9]